MSDPVRVTRRRMLGGVAAAGAGALVVPVAPALARAGSPHVFSRVVGSLHGVITVASSTPFALAGLQWTAPQRPHVQMRVRLADGAWGPWASAAVTGHDGDGRGQGFGEPLWAGRATELQLRAPDPVDGVRIHFVGAVAPGPYASAAAAAGPAAGPAAGGAAGGAHQASGLPLASPTLPAGPGQPPIIARAVWSGSHRPPRAGPYYGTIELAFVHHTENPNGYGRGEVPALLAAIYDYHRYVRGYFDIAYNFIIDTFGRIWEARAGGIDAPVQGAHAGDFNAVSTGVAVLGSFTDVVPSAAAQTALERLLGWKLALHGVPSSGHVPIRIDPSGVSYTPFAPNQLVSLPRVAGHRDGDSTDCPGDAFYHRLPAIRPRITALEGVPAELTLARSELSVAFGAGPVTVAGHLRRSGVPLAGAPLTLRSLPGDGLLADGATGADGSFTFTVASDRSRVLHAVHADRPAATSPVVVLSVVPVLTLSLAPGTPLRVRGTVAPRRASVLVDVYRLSGNRRHLVSHRRIAARDGRFGARLRLGSRHGTFVVVARVEADARTVAGESPTVRVTV